VNASENFFLIESFANGYKATADQQKNLIVANGRRTLND
jgi:hypothetical protein